MSYVRFSLFYFLIYSSIGFLIQAKGKSSRTQSIKTSSWPLPSHNTNRGCQSQGGLGSGRITTIVLVRTRCGSKIQVIVRSGNFSRVSVRSGNFSRVSVCSRNFCRECVQTGNFSRDTQMLTSLDLGPSQEWKSKNTPIQNL